MQMFVHYPHRNYAKFGWLNLEQTVKHIIASDYELWNLKIFW